MAALIISVGSLSATINASNDKAAALLAQYAGAIGAQGTDQEKLDACVAALVLHMQEQGRRQRSNTLQAEAVAAAQAEIEGLEW